jgi:hypothetical protein
VQISARTPTELGEFGAELCKTWVASCHLAFLSAAWNPSDLHPWEIRRRTQVVAPLRAYLSCPIDVCTHTTKKRSGAERANGCNNLRHCSKNGLEECSSFSLGCTQHVHTRDWHCPPVCYLRLAECDLFAVCAQGRLILLYLVRRILSTTYVTYFLLIN